MNQDIQVWVFINTSVYELFVVIRNIPGIKKINGKNNKMFFSHLNCKNKESFFESLFSALSFSQTIIFLDYCLTDKPEFQKGQL